MDYGFTHDGKVYTPNGTEGIPVEDVDARNAAIEQAELARWTEQPERQLGYYQFPCETPHTFMPMEGFPYDCAVCHRHRGIDRSCEDSRRYRTDFYPPRAGATVTTWPGTVIGHVTYARVYRHNFGGRMVSLKVRGTNGARYYGRASWDRGSCVVLRRAK